MSRLSRHGLRPPVLKWIAGGVVLAAMIGAAIFFDTSPQDVSLRFAAATQNLTEARRSGILKANSSLTRMPLPEVDDATQRKMLFIAFLLPLILSENIYLEEQRRLAAKLPEDGDAYGELSASYGLHENVPRDRLLAHIDTVPPSLVLAQAALESAWGMSRFARQGNAFFGQRTYDTEASGMYPGDADKGETLFKVKSFSNAQDSIRSYMKTLNSHGAYAEFRNLRAHLRHQNKAASGKALAPTLLNYSEIGSAYVKRLLATIQASQMHVYDRIKLEFQG
ncbi:MAG: glucosaminidase domain-containing protein [Rhodospirillales bacterium]|nr:glucosaminidase domain-containing protein [Rhodospirillales bacterium]